MDSPFSMKRRFRIRAEPCTTQRVTLPPWGIFLGSFPVQKENHCLNVRLHKYTSAQERPLAHPSATVVMSSNIW